MKHIVSIAVSSSRSNFDETIKFNGKEIRISHFGADFSSKVLSSLIERYDGNCDGMAISGIHPPVKIGGKIYEHKDSVKYSSMPKRTPISLGSVFRSTYIPWSINDRNLTEKVIAGQNVAVASGLVQQEICEAISQAANRMYFADPYIHTGAPVILNGMDQLNRYAKTVITFIQQRKITKPKSFIPLYTLNNFLAPPIRNFYNSDVVVSTSSLFDRIEFPDLKNKTVIIDVLPKELEERLLRAGARQIVHFAPDWEGLEGCRFNFATYEAILKLQKSDSDKLTSEDILELVNRRKLRPGAKLVGKGDLRKVRKFAFIVHPLSLRDLFRHPMTRPFNGVLQKSGNQIEKMASRLQGIEYGKIMGIESTATGAIATGTIYTLFDTPSQMLSAPPDKIYKKLVALCERAAQEGAELVGLGAFTKIVGDAGVTVAERSPIPVTTGNSLSASSTLWAARLVSDKLGLLGTYSKGKRLPGTAIVIGATGSIGAVSARLLAGVATKIILTGQRPEKLLELKHKICDELGQVDVEVTTDNGKYISDADLIVISTSSTGGPLFDLEKVKPGAVICDVGRPLTFSAKEAMTRPDVMIIDSGEVILPGNVRMTCDLGLEDDVVYACLAETALLALEGKMESFTLSRNISYKKVNEIYDLARKHGARLAAISGPTGLVSDQEIELCREHALRRR